MAYQQSDYYNLGQEFVHTIYHFDHKKFVEYRPCLSLWKLKI
jgi:hypothetical protein